MDESIFASPLETNLNNLIYDQFTSWKAQFKQFSSFTELACEVEERREKALNGFNQNLLPEACKKWITSSTSASSAFVTIFTSEFRPKLQKELDDLSETQKESLGALKDAKKDCKEPAGIILKNLNDLLVYFKSDNKKTKTTFDPWLNELSIRHYSSKYLDQKALYLEVLYRIYVKVRSLNSELALKLKSFTQEFFLLLERFGLTATTQEHENNREIDYNTGFTSPRNADQWNDVLSEYSLDYDWKLSCPPLDGFLSTLYTSLKSENIPSSTRLFAENGLRFGFLQKSVSGLLSRSWQVNFAILQPATGFLHLYKVNKSSTLATEGNLLVPAIGSEYSKASLHDLNTLATQFYLQNPHQPASISAQTLTPFLSLPITKDCKVVASDPVTFTFIVKPAGGGDKVNLRAFCEEEFVDWVIFLNETTGKTKKVVDERDYIDPKKSGDNIVESPKAYPTNSSSSSESKSSSPEVLSTTIDPSIDSMTSSSIAPIVEIENPWN